MKKNRFRALVGILLMFGSVTVFAVSIPNTFTANTPASAIEVNANFTALSNAADANAANLLSVVTALDSAYRYSSIYYSSINFSTTYGASVSEVLTATCPTGSLLVGGGVTCSSNSANWSTTNFGVVNATIPVGNSIIGSCVADALTYLSYLYGPPVTVRAICLSPAIIPPQAAKGGDGMSTSGQGVPTEEALLVIENIKKAAAFRQTIINQ